MLKGAIFKQLPLFLILLPASFLLFAIVWHLFVNETLYHCIDDFPIGDFSPPFVHKEALGSDYFIAPPVVVYSLWLAFVVGIFALPLVIIRWVSSRKVNQFKIVVFAWGVLILLFLLTFLFGLTPVVSLKGDGVHYELDKKDVSYVDTVFAEDFPIEKFQEIKQGMEQKEVGAILGKPLYIKDINNGLPISPSKEGDFKIDENMICWQYSDDGKLKEKGDEAWYQFLVCFKEGKVSSKSVYRFGD